MNQENYCSNESLSQARRSTSDFEFFDDLATFVLSKSASGLSFLDEHCDKTLSRENSQSMQCTGINDIILSRENSDALKKILEMDCSGEDFLVLSRENSTSNKFISQTTPEPSTALDRCSSPAAETYCHPQPISEKTFALPTSQEFEIQIDYFGLLGSADSKNPSPAVEAENSPEEVGRIRTPQPPSPVPSRGEPHRAGRRGAHVRENPEMQRTARDGAVHWATQLRVVRAAWAARAFWSPAFWARFAGQAEAAQGRIKSKQECLLRFLHMAAADGIIAAAPFSPAGGFFGWTRFAVARDRAAEFRAGLAALYPAGFKEDTLKETFRRAGLVPERFQWEQGWRGEVAFEYRPQRARF